MSSDLQLWIRKTNFVKILNHDVERSSESD